MTWASLGIDSARELVDLKHARADSQLAGAVAIHNILQRERVAYLADEVGLGKTYVALATAALMRHFDPGFRVLVIAPRSNIQRKWTNDWRAFVSRNWIPTDLRVKSVSGSPARPPLVSERLVDLVHDVAIEPDTDVFARLTSFSFAAAGDPRVVQERVRRVLPWLKVNDFPRDERKLRDFVAQAYNAAMPIYDLVIIDEAHNLKGGVQVCDGDVGGGALRNAILTQVLGHPEVTPHPLFADTYRPLAERVLLLSATPVEESFRNLWNQLHLVGKHAPAGRTDFAALKADGEQARETAARVLVRRINTVEIGGVRHTKSQYRRTWHHGGIATHDEPLSAGTIRQRLSVALVQKKVSDLIGTKFGNQFQMGMLASFESFAETALKQPKVTDEGTGSPDDESPTDGNFDGDQTTDPIERLGIDTGAVNHLARNHYDTFGVELAHPKMDALATDLARSWRTGEKALVFVRRVASVTEIKRKLDESYDEWLLERLENELPPHVWTKVTAAHVTYSERRAAEGRHLAGPGAGDRDTGGADTFFAWFFRGEGPQLTPTAVGEDPIESGASLARRLGMASGAASTFFAEHYLADLLGCRPDEVLNQLGEILGESPETMAKKLEERARHFLPSSAGRRHTFDAVQAAGLELIRDGKVAHQPLQDAATVLIGELQLAPGDRRTLAFDVRRQLTTPTFFTRLIDHRELAEVLLPTSVTPGRDKAWVREHYVRTALLTAAGRLGQPLIDLYGAFMHVSRRGSVTDNKEVDAAIDQFLALLDRQRNDSSPVGAFAELASIARDFDLLRLQNLPSTSREEFLLAAAGAECGTLMGKQQPTVGMAGRVNQTAVRQFRMPGYPFALICTDVLQEGEDLHTYCDRVIHYGVAWTASAMEQRTGRVDRINSLAERRFVDLQKARRLLEGHDKIQVQLPYLTETVERVQARTVLRRMHTFVSLMHQGLDDADERRLDLAAEILNDDWLPPQVEQPLESAFEVKAADLKGRSRGQLASDNLVEEWWARFLQIVEADELSGYFTKGNQDRERLAVYGSRPIGDRVQPFSLQLLSQDSVPVVSARTPIGRLPDIEGGDQALIDELAGVLDRVIVLEHAATREYDVAIAGDVILGDPEHDAARVLGLIRRISDRADLIESELTRGDLKLADVQTTMQKDVVL